MQQQPQEQEQQPNTDDSDDNPDVEPKETDTIADDRMDRFTWEAGDIVFDEDEDEDDDEEDTGERPVVKP